MDLEKLSCLCHWLGLSYEQFSVLKGRSESDIWGYLKEQDLLKESVSLLDHQKKVEQFWHEAKKYVILHPEHLLYPPAFKNMACPPVFLNLLGDSDCLLAHPQLAVVGARDVEMRFLQWMDEHLSFFCEQSSAGLVSGGARGVDQKVTRIAQKYEAPHIIFLPAGLDVPYPGEISQYYGCQRVLIISEYFPHEKMQRGNFIRRNRLISGMSDGVLIVQAAQKSGTMITAKYAIEQNKTVAVIPDFPGYRKTQGGLSLLRDGAHLVSDGVELVSLFLK